MIKDDVKRTVHVYYNYEEESWTATVWGDDEHILQWTPIEVPDDNPDFFFNEEQWYLDYEVEPWLAEQLGEWE